MFILLVPTFWRMLKPGIFSMHDFHPFRLYEYDKCIKDLQIPCRWAQDAALGYGEPLFNFYTQLPYLLGEVLRFAGLSVLDSIKGLFILSLVGAAVTMFLLAKQLWGNNLGAVLVAILYSFAPYRAVDVFVRGALPEALAFVLYPLIIFTLTKYVQSARLIDLILFDLSLSLLVLTHNLSVLMFVPFLLAWSVYLLYLEKRWRLIPKLALSSLLVIGLTAFYILPVAVENQFVTLSRTTEGYYDYQAHFVTLKQLLISKDWGYGGSTWGEGDGMSFSIGHLQWVIPGLIFILSLMKGKRLLTDKPFMSFLVLLGLGWFYLWLTHGKSVTLWQLLPPLKFVQFPWRFLAVSLFALALSSGYLFELVKNQRLRHLLATTIIALVIALNTGYFFEDLWYKETDQEYFNGNRYQIQTSSAIYDFWPIFGEVVPTQPVTSNVNVIEGTASGQVISRSSSKVYAQIEVLSDQAELALPLTYFPGWEVYVDEKRLESYPSGRLGLVTFQAMKVNTKVMAKLVDTPIRRLGNVISFSTIILIGGLIVFSRKRNVPI